MNCEMDLCIYNRDCECTLDGISIDETGACADCIFVSIEKEELEKYKKQLLDRYKEYD